MKFIRPQENKKIPGIYKIYHEKSDRSYIGCSLGILHRWEEHATMLQNNNHSNSWLQNAYNKYKDDKDDYLVFSILEECRPGITFEELALKEEDWIARTPKVFNFILRPSAMNQQKNALKGGPKIAEIMRKKWADKAAKEEMARKVSETRKEMFESKELVISEESKQKLSDNAKVNPNYGMKGKRHSQETIDKISETIRAKTKEDPTFRQHNPENKKQRVMSEEQKQMLSRIHTGMKNPNAKTFDVVLKDPEGNIHNNVYCLSQFCKNHHLIRHHLRDLIHGKRKQYKGWVVIR